MNVSTDNTGPKYLSDLSILCRNAIPNCGRHRLPTNEHRARRASWMRTDRATSSIRGTSESSKRIITLHTKSAARERTNIYTTECIYPKDQTPKHTTGGLSQKCVEHQTGRQGPHCIAKHSTNPPSQVYLPTGYGLQ